MTTGTKMNCSNKTTLRAHATWTMSKARIFDEENNTFSGALVEQKNGKSNDGNDVNGDSHRALVMTRSVDW
jgi:hypothetical protein